MTPAISLVAFFSILLVSPSLTQERLQKPIMDFALSMAASSRGEDVLFSPLSVSSVLSLLLLGAQGNTAQELRQVLQYGDSDAEPRFHQSYRELLEDIATENDVKVSVKNKIFIREGFNVYFDYLQRSEKYYLTSLAAVDFLKSESARKYINEFVSNETKGKIPELMKLPPGENTVEVLVSTLYFNGLWVQQFDPEKTTKGEFYVSSSSNETAELHYMIAEEMQVKYRVDRDLGALLVSLPYQGKRWRMYAIKPYLERGVESLTRLEEKLTTEALESLVERSTERTITLHMPKLSVRKTIDLKDELGKLGIREIFDPDLCDFSRMTPDNQELYVSAAVHEAFIDINEAGTEAAAATVAEIDKRIKPKTVSFNTPFIIVIMNEEDKIPLIWMRVVKPDNN